MCYIKINSSFGKFHVTSSHSFQCKTSLGLFRCECCTTFFFRTGQLEILADLRRSKMMRVLDRSASLARVSCHENSWQWIRRTLVEAWKNRQKRYALFSSKFLYRALQKTREHTHEQKKTQTGLRYSARQRRIAADSRPPLQEGNQTIYQIDLIISLLCERVSRWRCFLFSSYNFRRRCGASSLRWTKNKLGIRLLVSTYVLRPVGRRFTLWQHQWIGPNLE